MSSSNAKHAHERERFVDDLLGYLSLEEKIGQLILVPDVEIAASREERSFLDQLHRGVLTGIVGVSDPTRAERLQRIAIEETRHGIPLLFTDEIGRGFDTVMPLAISAASSWDIEAIENAERAIGEQASRRGINWALGPTAAMMPYTVRSGFGDSCGESPWLCAHQTAARIRGLQSSHGGLVACLRENGEHEEVHDRRREDEFASSARHQILMHVLEYGQPGSVAFRADSRDRNDRGQFSTALFDGERRDGIRLEDWVTIAARSGHDLASTPYVGLSLDRIRAAVQDGRLEMDILDSAVRQVLGTKFDLGLFRLDFESQNSDAGVRRLSKANLRSTALDMARKSIVLLRNRPAVLPLSQDADELLVVGTTARAGNLPLVDASGEAASVIDGLEALGIAFKFVPGLAVRHGEAERDRMIDADRMAIGMAGEAARRAGTVLVVLGDDATTADGSRLGEAHTALIGALQACNDRIVLLTLGERPLDPDVVGKPLASVLHAGKLGTMSGHAIAEILSGEAMPTARLPYAIRTRSGEERLPFGHGLTFTDFALNDFSLELGAEGLVAGATLHNTGDRDGKEVVQLYIRQIDGDLPDNTASLKGFRRISLARQTSERVAIEIGARELGEYREDGTFHVQPGTYEIHLGRNAAMTMSGQITLSKAVARAILARSRGRNVVLPFDGSDRRLA